MAYRLSFRAAVAALYPVLAATVVAQAPTSGTVVDVERGIPCSRLETGLLLPPIDTTYVYQPRRPENPEVPPPIEPKNDLPLGGIGNFQPVRPGPLWPGIGATGWVPADCTLAVGPNHIVETVNSSIAFFTKTGTLQLQQTSATFFSGLGAGTFQFDPKVFYDRVHARFVVVILEQDSATQVSKLLFAVSDDSDPNGTWYRYRLESRLTVGTTNYWLDYPGFGYNKDAYVVSGNMFGFSSGWAGVQFVVVPAASVLSGGAATRYSLRDSAGASVQVCEMISSTAANVFAVSTNGTSSLKVYSIGNLTGTPTWTSTTVAIPSFVSPSRDANSTSGRVLDSLDGRLFQATWRPGKLVAAHTTQNGTLRCRWYDVNTGSWPTSGGISLTQSGEVANTSYDYHMPGINVNAAGDISMIFTRSSTTVAADIMTAGRRSTDTLGTMGTPTLLESSAGNNYASGRWGDYFKVDVDPSNDSTFWGVAMDINSSNGWKTSIFSWTLGAPTAPPTPTGLTASPGNGQVALSWNASSGATSYNVKRSTTSGGPYTTVGSPTGTSFTNTGLTNGTTYYFVVSAVNAVGESANSAQVSATPTASSTQLLLNPGFESGAVNWVQTAGVIDNSTGRPARTGSWKAWLNGYGMTHTDTLYQQVTIPSTATAATLSFWLRIDTAETTTTVQYDKLQVQIRNSSNAVLATLATYSNLNKNTTYTQKSFNVLAYKGQAIRVYLLGTEDSSLQTSFVCDDFALNVN